MKNGAILLTALVAFALGYFVRGFVAPEADDSDVRLDPAAESQSAVEVARQPAQTADANVESIVLSVPGTRFEVDVSNEEMENRRFFKQKQIGEFFVIRNIGEEEANQIRDGLIKVDLYIAAIRQSMIDRQISEAGEPLSQFEIDMLRPTDDESTILAAEKLELQRQVLDEHFEAHQDYERKHLQWQVVGSLSNSVEQPLDYATKENLVEIMHQEQSSMNLAMAPYLRIQSEDWETRKMVSERHIDEMRAYNERVLSRVRPYLTVEQFDLLRSRFGKDVRSFELLIENMDIEDSY